ALWHRQSIDRSVRFSQSFATHPESNRVMTKAAEDLFALNEFGQAATVAEELTQRQNVDPELQLTAYTVLGHSQFDTADYLKAEFAYVQALSLMPAEDEKREDMVERLASSIYKQGEIAREGGDLSAAVQHFGRIKAVAPNSEVRPIADYDAAAAMIELQDFKNAAVALQEFRNNYSDHELAADVDTKLAFTYLASDQPEQAAEELVNIARKTDDVVVKEDSIWQAAALFEKAGNWVRTEQTLEFYVESFPTPVEQATEARQRLADLTKKAGNTGRYNHWLDEIIRGDAQAGSQRTDRTRYLAAKASLIRARPSLDAYRGTKLTVPLKASLKVKKKRLEEALAAYGRAADYGVSEVTTAATFSIGEIYSDFGSALMSSDRPSELSAEELEQYDILLEEQAYPFEEKAIEIHEANVRRIADGNYDDWVKASLSRLAQLVPARYNKAERSEKIVAAIH
ncbi:MAG: tetratricopeptide repeat protein, partial [Pseudomonadota bacterium]